MSANTTNPVADADETGIDRAQMNHFLQNTVFGSGVEKSKSHQDKMEEEEALKAEWFGLKHPDTRLRHAYDSLQLAP